jgi:8-oxo-dGTP pyrophosphatase MutT (NUDIX family)
MRELAEETGLDVELGYLGEDVYEDEVVREVARVYHAHHSGPVTFTDGEVIEACWVALDDLCDFLATREVCPDSHAIVLPRLDAP